jgi:hypothetical protein
MQQLLLRGEDADSRYREAIDRLGACSGISSRRQLHRVLSVDPDTLPRRWPSPAG